MFETERDDVHVRRVFDHDHGSVAFDAAGRAHVRRDHGHRLAQDALIGDRRNVQVAHELESPAGVIVRTGVCDRVVLQREIHVSDRAIRLIGADDVITRLDVDIACPE
jgi:hypothetical protein